LCNSCIIFDNSSQTAPTTVVFESGSRITLDKWNKVITEVAKANVVAYNRPG